jgi:hypothetical protein
LWPLNNEKLQALKQLVQEQLEHKHTEPSFSPCNYPVFVIKKKIFKWKIIDLRNANTGRIPRWWIEGGSRKIAS